MANFTTNGICIEYETFGERKHPALLLIMGLGAQMIFWEDDFCRAIANPRDCAGTIGDRRRVRHANDRRKPARRCRARSAFDRFLPTKSGLAKMNST